MNNRQSIWISLLLAGLVIAAIAGLYSVNTRFSEQNNGGSRFIVYWAATRSFVVEGDSLYSEETAAKVEAEVRGWSPQPDSHELKVVFPLYTLPFFLPFASVGNYIAARSAWMTLLEVAVIIQALFVVRLSRWQTGLPLLGAYFIFALFGLHTVTAVVEGNAVILAGLLAVLALTAIRAGVDEAAGALLALAMVKPAAVLVLVGFVLYWALTQRRWRLVVWFAACVLLFTAAGMFFDFDWPLQYARLLVDSTRDFLADTPSALFAVWWPGVGEKLGQAVSAVILAILAFEWWLAKDARDFGWFLWAASLSLAAGQWVGVPAAPENFILLLLPLALVFSGLEERWKKGGQAAIWIALLLVIGIPWLVYWRAGGDLSFEIVPPAGLLFLLPLIELVGLFWVRWWMIRPKRTYLDEMRARGDF